MPDQINWNDFAASVAEIQAQKHPLLQKIQTSLTIWAWTHLGSSALACFL